MCARSSAAEQAVSKTDGPGFESRRAYIIINDGPMSPQTGKIFSGNRKKYERVTRPRPTSVVSIQDDVFSGLMPPL